MNESILIAGLVLLVLLLSLVLSKKNKLKADKFLIAFLVFELVSQIYLLLEKTDWLQHSYWMLLGKGLYLLDSPLFFLYVFVLTHNHRLPNWLFGILFTPWLLYAIHFLYFYWSVFPHSSVDASSGLVYINNALSPTWLFFVIVMLLIEPVYLSWFYRILKQYRMRLHDALSKTEGIELRWLNTLFYLRIFLTLILVPAGFIAIANGWIRLAIFQSMLEVSGVVFFFVVGYFGFKQTTIFVDGPVTLKEKPIPSYERSGLSAEDAARLHTQLVTYMQTAKPYLQGDLRASDVAAALNISVNHLSQVLNTIQNQNFFDFINTHRVEEVKQRIADKRFAHLTILAIALDCGFNSKSAFNTVFKKTTGVTPSQYARQVSTGV